VVAHTEAASDLLVEHPLANRRSLRHGLEKRLTVEGSERAVLAEDPV
jgi:hypothetical protein